MQLHCLYALSTGHSHVNGPSQVLIKSSDKSAHLNCNVMQLFLAIASIWPSPPFRIEGSGVWRTGKWLCLPLPPGQIAPRGPFQSYFLDATFVHHVGIKLQVIKLKLFNDSILQFKSK